MSATTTAFTVTGLSAGASTELSVSTVADTGTFYSTPVFITVRTPSSSRPDIPTNVAVSGIRGTNGCLRLTSCALGAVAGPTVTVSANVSDPDGDAVTAHVELTDLGTSDSDSPVVVLGPDDPAGASAPVHDRVATVRVPASDFVAQHRYRIVVVADDGTSRSAQTGAYYLAYAPHPPVMGPITASESTFRVGDAVTFSFTATDDNPPASGISYFLYSFDNSSSVDQYASSTVVDGTATGSVSTTLTSFGTHYLYVQAVDRAGNLSPVSTMQYYVRS